DSRNGQTVLTLCFRLSGGKCHERDYENKDYENACGFHELPILSLKSENSMKSPARCTSSWDCQKGGLSAALARCGIPVSLSKLRVKGTKFRRFSDSCSIIGYDSRGNYSACGLIRLNRVCGLLALARVEAGLNAG